MDRFGPKIGASQIGGSVYELPPGQSICPYHYEYPEEEWLMPLDGVVIVRTPEGEAELGSFEVVAFPPGAAGAHKVTNRGSETVRVLMLSTKPEVSVCVYPDSDKVLAVLARGPAPVASVVRGRLLRRGGVSVAEPLVFDTAVDLATETATQTFDGAQHGVDASFMLVHMEPGRGPSLHRHAYPEVFIVASRRGDVHGRRRRVRRARRADGGRAGGRRAPVREHGRR